MVSLVKVLKPQRPLYGALLSESHLIRSLSSPGTGQFLNLLSAPNVYLHAALPATRPKTTQSNKELPPRRLFPWMPPATSPAQYRPGIGLPSAPSTAEFTSI